MFRRIVSAAVFAAVAGVTVAQAQTIGQIGGPKELPPPGFKGQMYVDSRGCVFLKAGMGGVTNWVPRVSKDRKALCGYPPTMAALGKPVAVAPDLPQVAEAPAHAPRATGKPMATVAGLTTPPRIRAAAPQVVDPRILHAQPAPVAQQPARRVVVAQAPVAAATVARAAVQPALPVVAAPGVSGRQIGCYASAPVAQVVALSNGGTAVLCTRGDGTLIHARAPIYRTVAMGDGVRVGAGLYPPGARVVSRSGFAPGGLEPARRVAVEEVPVPQGYKLAWTDDRLNPHRGVGTAQGQAAQDQVWSREVPAQLVPGAQPGVRYVTVSGKEPKKPRVQVSTKSDPAQAVALQRQKPVAQVQAQTQAAGGRFFVQVGTFGVPENAEGARARLRAAGLPVGTSKLSKGGKAMQIVLAGPFGDAASAQGALRAARGAGFGDAFVR